MDSGVTDPVAIHNSYVAAALVFEAIAALSVGCAFIATFVDWIDKRGWRPKDKQRKL